MTVDKPMEPQGVCNGISPQQSENPFHIVLIDIKKAAQDEYIHCVKKPLMGNQDLKFVALSYRSGEVQETAVDTQLGYMANVTAFDLQDFYKLCKMMTQETDLKAKVDYVWVDAICIDPAKRKDTYMHINHIYERANYIVAIPDLHLTYLQNINKTNVEMIQVSLENNNYIYHLIHGHLSKLEELDQQWLDSKNTPNEPKLRFLLTRYTDYFANGFMKCKHHHWGYDAQHSLGHIFATNPKSRTAPLKHLHFKSIINEVMRFSKKDFAAKMKQAELEAATKPTTADLDKRDLNNLHICDKDDRKECPLEFFADGKWKENDLTEQHGDFEWKQAIPERGECIRRCIKFLVDLIQDWATRVWAISEIHMAKKKQGDKMKFWFIQLGLLLTEENGQMDNQHKSFFEFNFAGGDHLQSLATNANIGEICKEFYNQTVHFQTSNAVYQAFHVALQQQLREQRFLEMVLKSNTSRNENRMYSILPISEYKDKLGHIFKDHALNDHTTLVSVKLELYDWMTIKHKWQLLFLSSYATNIGRIFPTFGTSNILWPDPSDYPNLETDNKDNKCSFDMKNEDAIKLTRQNNMNILKVKPKFYFHNDFSHDEFYSPQYIKPIIHTLSQFNYAGAGDHLDFIFLPHRCKIIHGEILRPNFDSTRHIFLVGYSAENKWILCPPYLFKATFDASTTWKFYNDGATFDIY